MTIGYPAAASSAKAASYDRITAMQLLASYLSVAPHANTQRWTYTVPTARMALVEAYWSEVYRATAAGAVVESEVLLYYTPNGGAAQVLSEVVLASNTPYVQQQQQLAALGIFQAGDNLASKTNSADTGGTVVFASALKAYEFTL